MDGEEPTETLTRHHRADDASAPATDHSSAGEAFRSRRRELRSKYKHLPSRFKGYEALMETFDDPAMNVPSGKHNKSVSNSQIAYKTHNQNDNNYD